MPSWATGQDAAAPPAIASSSGPDTSPSGGTFVQPKPFAASPGGSQQSSAVAGGALEDDNESCVVCMSAPVQAGFLHGSRSVPCMTVVASSPGVDAVIWLRSSICRGTLAYKVPTDVVVQDVTCVGVLHVKLVTALKQTTFSAVGDCIIVHKCLQWQELQQCFRKCGCLKCCQAALSLPESMAAAPTKC